MNIKKYSYNEISKLTINDVISQANDDINFDHLVLELQLTNSCNYKCSYCYGQEPIGKDNFMSTDTIKSILKQVFALNKKYYYITLIGGEVIYLPNLFDILDYIDSYDLNIEVSIITNASKKVDYFKKFKQYKKYIKVSLSIHLEYVNIDNIKEIVKLFNEYGDSNFNIFMMPHPLMKEKFEKFSNELIEYRKNYGFNLFFTEILEPPQFNTIDSRYDSDYLELIQKLRIEFENIASQYCEINKENNNFNYSKNNYSPCNYYTIKKKNNELDYVYIHPDIALINGLRKFKDFYCCGGYLLRVDYNGDYFSKLCHIPKIGNIYEENIDFIKLAEPMVCPLAQCGCRTDMKALKYKYKDEANDYFFMYKLYLEKNKINSMTPYELYLFIKDNINNSNNKDVENINNKLNTLVDSIAWWIPVKKWRDNFRNKILYGQEQSRAEQSRAEQSRAEQ
ncbi:radical SAM protein, partial [Brachyspira intermedia]|uniref:radical SAM protein n=1 Tax=Brachyspira intermedia TaxID=84377 RepID=UPI003004685C